MNPINWLAHADWSVHSSKRWICIATITPNDITVDAPRMVEEVASPERLITTLIDRHGATSRGVLGLDVCLGIPIAYAKVAGVDAFVPLLRQLGTPPWHQWFDVAETVEQITVHRPFYPLKGGRKKMDDLVNALGLQSRDALRRHCDYDPLTGKRWGAPLFWTMGAAQVGKASLHAWEHVVQPALLSPDVCLWPHQHTQLHTAQVIITEAFPTAYYRALNLQAGSKRDPTAHVKHLPSLQTWSLEHRVHIDPQIFELWHDAHMEEDAFDSLIGCLGMIDAWLHQRLNVHDDPLVRQVEGGIWGLPIGKKHKK